MYTLKNLRNMMKNHTGMLVLLVISMFVSFGVLFFGVGLYYQYSKNIEDGEIDSYAVGFSINDIITKKNFCEFVKNMPNKLMGDVSYITCFSSTQVSGIDEEIPVAFYLQYSEGKFEYSDNVFQPMIDDLVIKDGSFFTQGVVVRERCDSGIAFFAVQSAAADQLIRAFHNPTSIQSKLSKLS